MPPKSHDDETNRQLSRQDFTRFSQSLCQVALDAFYHLNNAFLAEYRLLHNTAQLRQTITVNGTQRSLPVLIRCKADDHTRINVRY